jgi:chromosome partitioning protein
MTGHPVPFAVLFTRTNPTIRTRTTSHITQSLKGAGIPLLETELHEREAFRAMFCFRQTLDQLNPSAVANIDKAIANALVDEVVDLLRQFTGTRPGPEAMRVA